MFYPLITLPLFASIAPFLLWPIEYIFPYPYIVEEFWKVLCIPILLSYSPRKIQLFIALLTGFVFALSESVLYVFNIIQNGSFETLIVRLILTTLLHSGTLCLMLGTTYINKKLLPVGLILGIFIHYFYNMLLSH